MGELIIYAIPFFILAIVLEFVTLRIAASEHDESDGGPGAPVGFEVRDTGTSLTMGLGHLFIAAAWKIVWLAILAAIFVVSPFQLSPGDWWVWLLLFFADDLAYYCYHRSHHRVRLFWATHVVHHSSEHYNFSTALRQDWSPFTATFFWLPLALFFEPWMIFLAMSWSLLYQFTLHTEAIDRLPRPIEFIFNTPSHHRVHHGSQEQYLDRNYAGILIIWDRMFGTFEPEGERVRYGLTTNINTFNPVKVAYGEFANIWRDVKSAGNWRHRFSFAFRGPGWKPDESAKGSSENSFLPDDRGTSYPEESPRSTVGGAGELEKGSGITAATGNSALRG